MNRQDAEAAKKLGKRRKWGERGLWAARQTRRDRVAVPQRIIHTPRNLALGVAVDIIGWLLAGQRLGAFDGRRGRAGASLGLAPRSCGAAAFDEPDGVAAFDEPDGVAAFDEPDGVAAFDEPDGVAAFDDPDGARAALAMVPELFADPRDAAASLEPDGAARGARPGPNHRSSVKDELMT